MKAPTLFPMPLHASATRQTTRARRDAARKWAAKRSLPAWPATVVQCRCCDSTIGGVVLGPFRELCWDCLPVPGSPVRAWEHWQTDADGGGATWDATCIRCERVMSGGLWCRGGPFCWTCGKPPEDEYAAWLLALREKPETPAPWAGDRKGTNT